MLRQHENLRLSKRSESNDPRETIRKPAPSRTLRSIRQTCFKDGSIEVTSLPPGASSGAAIGQVLGGSYKILRALGQGAMGSVYVAEHLRLKRQVAIKILATHLRENEKAHARFVREAEIVSQLHHPHIVQLFD